MSECVIDVVKEHEEAEHLRMGGSCHVPGVGTLHLYRYRDSDYQLMLEHSVYGNKPILKCGRQIQRSINTNLVVQFYDYDQLAIITTKDNWKTVREERQPHAKLRSYFKVSNPFPHVDMRKSPPDLTIHCEDGYLNCFHSAVLSPRWPFLRSQLRESNSSNMDLPTGLVAGLVILLYGYPFDHPFKYPGDVCLAGDLLKLATTYELPELVLMTSHIIYTTEITQKEAFRIRKIARKYNEAVAVYCALRTRGQHRKDGRTLDEEMLKAIYHFTLGGTAEEKETFDRHENLMVPLPSYWRPFFYTCG